MEQTTSASCSIAPDSRRSESCGRRCSPPRCSGARDSCDSATTGTSSSFASALSEREMNEISCWRLSASVGPCIIWRDRKSTRLNSSHTVISYAVFCLKKKKKKIQLRKRKHKKNEDFGEHHT